MMPQYLKLAEETGIGVEFQDFCRPEVLGNPTEYSNRLEYALNEIVPLSLPRSLHTPFRGLNPHSPDPWIRQQSQIMIGESMETAAKLECTLVVIHSVYNDNWSTRQEMDQAVDLFVPFLERLLSRSDMLLCLENIHDPNPDFLSSLGKALPHPRLGFCLDVGHMASFGKVSFETWYNRLGDRTFHNHWHDNHGDKDSHLPLGDGSIDWSEITSLKAAYCPQSSIALELTDPDAIPRSLKEIS